jgi:hypothetical protein
LHEAALHDHLLGESPRVMYMHLASHGDPVQMARAIHDVLALTKTPGPDTSASSQPQADLAFDRKQVEQALGQTGKVNGGILQFSIPRAEQITDSGITIPPSMGVATAINFQPTGGGKAAITGDFVLLGSEVNAVIKALRDNAILVTALHNHMLTEQPRLSSCISGPIMTPQSWPKAYAPRSTGPTQENKISAATQHSQGIPVSSVLLPLTVLNKFSADDQRCHSGCA